MEGLHGPTKYNGLAESGTVLDPHIICKNLGDCPTRQAERHLVRDEGGRRFKSCHSDQFLAARNVAARQLPRQIFRRAAMSRKIS